MDDEPVERNTIQTDSFIVPNDPVANQPTEANVESLYEDLNGLKTYIVYDYVYFHETDFNISKLNDPNSFNDAVFCPDIDDRLALMQEDF